MLFCMYGAPGGVSLHLQIGFSLAFASQMVLRLNLKKKRLIERLTSSKSLITKEKIQRRGISIAC
jgi:hypothetical protein